MTPTGVRDGDPDALAGLCDVRGPAVFAYCEVVAGRGERSVAAAAEAMGSFRAGVVLLADDLSTLNPEALLISATRHAAARHASVDAPEGCARVPGLLAARADRSITHDDHAWLDEHLASCWTCRAPVARFKVADQAYLEPPDASLPPEVKLAMLAAMTAAAPTRQEAVQPPAPAETGQYTNGASAHAHPEPAPPDEPYTAYDLPALGDGGAAPVEQPTSYYQMPAEDLATPDVPDRSRRARKRRRSGLLGTLGLASSGESATAATPAARTRRRSARGATAAAAGSRAARNRRPARASATPAPAEGADTASAADPRAAGGAAIPRPRRELSRRPSNRDHRVLRPAVVLPVALVVVAIIVALAIAGVFGGGEPASVPQSFAPAARDTQTSTQAAPVVVVPGASAAVEKAKARARAAKRRAAAAAANDAEATTTRPAAGATTAPAAADATPPPPPPPPPPPSNSNTSGSGKPKIDAGNGATGAEQLPPADDTSTVPDLAPPVEPVAPPPG